MVSECLIGSELYSTVLYQGNRRKDPWLCVIITIEPRTQVSLVLGRVRFEAGYERKGRVWLRGWNSGKVRHVQTVLLVLILER